MLQEGSLVCGVSAEEVWGFFMKKLKVFIIVEFCLILFSSPVATLLSSDKEFSDMENRELAQKPVFSGKSFLDCKYQDNYEEWLNDQFFWRDGWSFVATNLQAAFGKKDINGVYLGKNGCLLEKYQETDFEQEQVNENTGYLSKFLNYAVKHYGEDHVHCMMLPSKAGALPDSLPVFAGPFDTGKVLKRLKDSLDEPDVLLDAGYMLRKHQKEYIYYRTDHHWTTLGAYYAWTQFAEAAGLPVEGLGHYQRETVFTGFYGTTYNKAHIRVAPDSVELFHNPGEKRIHVDMDDGKLVAGSVYFPEEAEKGFNKYNIFFSKNTFKIVVTTQAGTGKSLLLVKDSFANCFVPFLAEDYDQIIMVDYRYGKVPMKDIMEQYKDITDVLVMFNTEKFMQNTKLNRLADTGKGEAGMKKFNPDDFLE